ncbi:hypothetical protein Ga0061079_11413 [Apibacter mensalis]|uniref:MORN repeat variant n=1 Tax=Apibacter mensalis TaxID=1586267 RepID=A0A0X3APC9_9FLAO|nr:hypothetical protein [Apibacter mensalis]CVK16999.1 hypothetical protein Ga0061079_11413 [Apibacter mensalis]
MKKILLISISLLVISCQGQKKQERQEKKINKQLFTESKDTIMEKFNIKEFNKHQKNGSWIYKKNNEEYFLRKVKDEYWLEISTKDNPFILRYNYFLSGKISKKGLYFSGNGFNKGIWIDYDEKGNIIKQTNYDAPYKNFPWEKVKFWLETRKVDLHDPLTQIDRDDFNNRPIWYLSWDTKEHDKYGNQIIQDVELDGKTGEVLKETTHTFGEYIPEEYKDKSDRVKKNNQETSEVYKTYKGKSYTQQEWEEFEQKLFEEYAGKHNLRTAIDIEKERYKKGGGFFLGEREVTD